METGRRVSDAGVVVALFSALGLEPGELERWSSLARATYAAKAGRRMDAEVSFRPGSAAELAQSVAVVRPFESVGDTGSVADGQVCGGGQATVVRWSGGSNRCAGRCGSALHVRAYGRGVADVAGARCVCARPARPPAIYDRCIERAAGCGAGFGLGRVEGGVCRCTGARSSTMWR